MNNFVFYSPTEFVFGKNTEVQVGALARKYGAQKVMIVYGGGSVVRSGLLDTQTTPDMIRRASRGLTSEIVAGVCKLMSNLDLIYAAKKMRVTAHCNTTIGLPGTFSSRLQHNHTTDDPNGFS